MKFQTTFTKEEKQSIEKTYNILKNIKKHNFTELNGVLYSTDEIEIAIDIIESLHNYEEENNNIY